ncbi:MAG: IS4 family transposase [Planctomycetales bacterium]|nr:IS4 family transposase [Planctomycetales bacterium]
MQGWEVSKAAYRLFNCKQATFSAIAGGHWQRSREAASGHVLVLCDTTEIDFGVRRRIRGTGPTGNGHGNGFLLHNALLVEAPTLAIIGLGAQVTHTRPHETWTDNSAQKKKRPRESEIWGQTIDLVGRPQKGVQYTDVGDRAADNYEFFLHLLFNRHGWVLRAKARNRKVFDTNGEKVTLACALETLEYKGGYELAIREGKNSPARTADLEVFAGAIELPPPRHKSAFVKEHAPERLCMNVVWVRENNPPKNATKIEWILYTSHPVKTLNQCWKVLEYYEARWIIEEYHKSLKTGCRVEQRQLRTAHALMAATACLSVVAVALLQLKTHAKTDPERKAKEVVPLLWLQMLKAVNQRATAADKITVYEFYRQIAKLGGFLGRKSDGEPGWITIWRGWEQLRLLVRGAQLLATQQKRPPRSG